ncbi:MAG: ATP-binding cassette domain-containing protein [Planctomycetia bacterium]|nr:ATP-binding cassette domain-containing protein [Planctomycetia bacterium]
MNIVECRNLTKDFREQGRIFHALNRITFELEPGKIYGLLGPDGAGKTTLMRCLTGLYRPTSGTISVLGLDLAKQTADVQDQIGYMPQKFGLYENMSVMENLRLYADLHAVSKKEREDRFPRLLEMTNLASFTDRRAGKLSGGMKQKLALAAALVSRPRLMLLDEPSVGVDVLSRHELWSILRDLVDHEETTVLASTAYMDEADFCDRTLVLFEGELRADEPPKSIRNRAKPFRKDPAFEEGFQVLLTGSVLPELKRKKPPVPDAPIMVRAEHLDKRFGSFTAVGDLSFDVRRGEIFGLLGANGAGKTTTFRMLCGLSTSDGGTIEIAGTNLEKDVHRVWHQIGYVAQKFSLYADLTVRQNLSFFGGVYGLKKDRLDDRIEWGLDSFDLRDSADRVAGKLPLGYKQRLSMVCALLHDPPILFLDEATSGADPMTRHEFWKKIMDLADSGVAVIITTHFLDEARYCDRMVIMQDGREAAAGTAGEIIRQGGNAPTLEEAFVRIIREKRTGSKAETPDADPDPGRIRL